MVADNVSVGVGEIVKQFDGIYASVVDWWHSRKPSLSCVDDGGGSMVFWNVTMATMSPWGPTEGWHEVEQVLVGYELNNVDFDNPLP